MKEERRGAKKKIITRDMCLKAMRNTKSNKAAARYIGCSYQHYRVYAKMYKGGDEYPDRREDTLLAIHSNQSGKGIPKQWGGKWKDIPLDEIIETKLTGGIVSHFTVDKLKARLIRDGYLDEMCCRCGFTERRVIDYKKPLLLNFKDGNKDNWRVDNIELMCYNCYFLHAGNIYRDRDWETTSATHFI